jgi:predicted N-acetyltransferase YhbS
MNRPFHLPRIVGETAADAGAVAALVARAFGPGRFAKAAERLREGNRPLLALSPAAWSGEALVGCARMWPIRIGATPALLLGPFAVEATYRSQGLGAALIEDACAGARAAGHRLVLLVGDEAYFAPLGFSAAGSGRIIMPGPVDPRRVLTRALAAGAADDLAGRVSPAPDLAPRV